jgi:maltooligosyltrehalose trehalohydrolase
MATRRHAVHLPAVPDRSEPWLDRVDVAHGDRFLTVRRSSCLVVAHLADRRRSISVPGRPLSVTLATESCVNLTRDAADLPAESAAVGRHG